MKDQSNLVFLVRQKMTNIDSNGKEPVMDSFSESGRALLDNFLSRSFSEREEAFGKLNLSEDSQKRLTSIFMCMKMNKPCAWFSGSEANSPFLDLKNRGLVKFDSAKDEKSYLVVPRRKLLEQLNGLRAPDPFDPEMVSPRVPPVSGITRPRHSYGRILLPALSILGPH
jgi:hypothetical protein